MFFTSLFTVEVIYRLSFTIYMLLTGSLFDFRFIYRLPFSTSMLFTGSLFQFTGYLQAPFFDFHVIYRLLFTICMSFTVSLFRFTCYLQAPFFNLRAIYRLPFSIFILFTGSLFRFPYYLQAPFFDLCVIYSLPSISMLFTGSVFRFAFYLQAPFFDFHVIYRLPFSISISITKLNILVSKLHNRTFKNKGRCIVLKVSMHNLLTSIFNFVPCGRVVQRAYYRELAQVLSNLKGHCHALWQLRFIKSLKVPSHQLNSKTNDLILLSRHHDRLLGLFLPQV